MEPPRFLELTFFLGETPAEAFRNIDGVLQVLADASQYPGDSESVANGTWMILHTLAATEYAAEWFDSEPGTTGQRQLQLERTKLPSEV